MWPVPRERCRANVAAAAAAGNTTAAHPFLEQCRHRVLELRLPPGAAAGVPEPSGTRRHVYLQGSSESEEHFPTSIRPETSGHPGGTPAWRVPPQQSTRAGVRPASRGPSAGRKRPWTSYWPSPRYARPTRTMAFARPAPRRTSIRAAWRRWAPSATDAEFVIPAAIGTDINCGMRLLTTGLKQAAVEARKPEPLRGLTRVLLENGRNVPVPGRAFRALFDDGPQAFIERLSSEGQGARGPRSAAGRTRAVREPGRFRRRGSLRAGRHGGQPRDDPRSRPGHARRRQSLRRVADRRRDPDRHAYAAGWSRARWS